MRRQQGISFFGIIFIIAIIGGIVSIAIKVVPPYLDYLSVSEVTRSVINQPRAALERNDQIMKKIDNQLSINNISLSDYGKDAITLSRADGVLTADIDYYVEQPVYTSEEVEVSINMHFVNSHEASAQE